MGADQMPVPAEVLWWSAYNLVAYAVVPFAMFRRRYSNEQLSVHSTNRRGDLLVIVVILALESTVQLLINGAILQLTPRQILLGAPLTFVLFLAGTGLPAMVFIFCILTPRYLRLTGSVPATVILGGLTYPRPTPAPGGAAAAQVGSEFAPILLPSSVTFPVMLYAVAAYGRGREPVLALGVAVVGAMITTLRLWDPGTWTTGVPTGNGWRLFILIAMFAGIVVPWALGRFAACTRPTSAPSRNRPGALTRTASTRPSTQRRWNAAG